MSILSFTVKPRRQDIDLGFEFRRQILHRKHSQVHSALQAEAVFTRRP